MMKTWRQCNGDVKFDGIDDDDDVKFDGIDNRDIKIRPQTSLKQLRYNI